VEVLDIIGGAVGGVHKVGEETSTAGRLQPWRIDVHDTVDGQSDESVVFVWHAIYPSVAMETNVAV